ncbi:MAG: hypothetical protein HF982_07865 [Desulfobacteraceae bacterium]|nr:hypothetical protein [Desulfobacteraceae bacterium]MBC2719486.1 hypothetical protein [Desulfobacteraceae bacterium]
MMKKVWLTSLISSRDIVKKLMSQVKTYGLEVNGHFWEDDLEKVAWIKAKNKLIDPKIVLWVILASEKNLLTPAIQYGLSLLTIAVQVQRGHEFPIIILQTQGEPISPDILTTPLKGVDVLPVSSPGLGAKLVAKAHTPAKEISSGYRLDIHGNGQIGQWFEVGPRNIPWHGAMFGVACGEIAFHAVGPMGRLPSRSLLNYPIKGLKLSSEKKEYKAWAVQNELDSQNSYFVKVEGFPESIIFGSYSTEEKGEVYVVELKLTSG